MRMLKQSGTRPVFFLLVLTSDHISAATGLTPTVTISKDGAAFGSPAGVVAEIGSGWYKLTPTSADTGSLGALLLHATGTGADPVDHIYQVVAYDPESATNLGLSNLDALITSRMATYTQPTGFLASTFPTTVASTTNITAATGIVLSGVTHTGAVIPTVTTTTTATNVTNDVGITQAAADKAWSTTTRQLTGTQAFNLTGSITGSLSGSVGSVTGNVGGNVVGSVASVTARVTANADQLAGQTVTAAAGVTFPTSVASPTNITAGTITTVTNLTNAPTAGDLTATMKTSVTTAATAATPVAASVTGAVGSVTGNVGGNVTGSVGSVAGGGITAASFAVDAIDAGALAASATSEIATALLDGSNGVETGLTVRQGMRLVVAVAAGDGAGLDAASGTATFKDTTGTKTRISSAKTSTARTITRDVT